MDVSMSSILRTLKSDIPFNQPLYEAIANSLDANAKNIIIEFKKRDNIFDFNYIDSITVIDDGDGFTQDNITSFLKYMSEYKLNLGCKGVGRFTWLKIFNNIKIESQTKDKHILINFSSNFNDLNDIKLEERHSDTLRTSIYFSNILKEKNRNIEIDLPTLKKQILDYFMLKFIELKNGNINFKISLKFDEVEEIITVDDVLELTIEKFKLYSPLLNVEYEFEINYSFMENIYQTKNECFLCANGRIVEGYNLKKIVTSNLPNNSFMKVLIYSRYFDERVNDERTAFSFSKTENNPSIANPIPFTEISVKIEEILDGIVLKRFPSILEDNDRVIQECLSEKPYLSKYIFQDESLIKRKNDVLDKAQKVFEKEKENVKNNFIKILEQKEIDTNELTVEFEKINELSNRELAQYFLFRQVIIDSLKRLNDDNEKLEKYLHSLFLGLGEKSDKNDSISSKYNNCIWLLDDKFMSYEKLYSDAKISKIKKEILENSPDFHDCLEPDMTIFYSNHDVVVVEFKAIGTDANNKLVSYTEINRNLSVISKNFDDINSIYGYVITKFDQDFIDYVDEQPGIKKLFSSGKNPIYYLYNDNIKDSKGQKRNAYIYFISSETVYEDANSRNKIFIDIINNK